MLAPRPALLVHVPVVLITSLLLVSPFQGAAIAAKRKAVAVTPPELRIVTVNTQPDPYPSGQGSLDFNVEVELPWAFTEGTLLEVSSLISSPSMSSMRFLSVRQPMPSPARDGSTREQLTSAKSRVTVTLTWDGMDQAKQVAESGRYQYEVRAKLLTVGENGPRTHMNAWPKRGSLTVK